MTRDRNPRPEDREVSDGRTRPSVTAVRFPIGKAFFDRVFVFAFALSWSLAFLPRAADFLSPGFAPITLAGFVGGYALADLLAGIVHWIADRFFEPDTPLLGPMLIAPFREHHEDPLSITRHDFFEVSGNNALVTLPLVLAIPSLPVQHGTLAHGVASFGLSLTLALFLTNHFHAWAHAPSPPRAIRLLQRSRLVLRPESHSRHHRGPHDRAYCVTSGWLNPLLDRSRVFERLERWIHDERRPDGVT